MGVGRAACVSARLSAMRTHHVGVGRPLVLSGRPYGVGADLMRIDGTAARVRAHLVGVGCAVLLPGMGADEVGIDGTAARV